MEEQKNTEGTPRKIVIMLLFEHAVDGDISECLKRDFSQEHIVFYSFRGTAARNETIERGLSGHCEIVIEYVDGTEDDSDDKGILKYFNNVAVPFLVQFFVRNPGITAISCSVLYRRSLRDAKEELSALICDTRKTFLRTLSESPFSANFVEHAVIINSLRQKIPRCYIFEDSAHEESKKKKVNIVWFDDDAPKTLIIPRKIFA